MALSSTRRQGDLRQNQAGQSFGLGRQTASLIVVEPKPSAAKLFLEDSILFAKVVDGELLLLVHPSGHGDQQESEWVEYSQLVQNPLSRAQSRNTSGQALSIRSEFWTLRGCSRVS